MEGWKVVVRVPDKEDVGVFFGSIVLGGGVCFGRLILRN